MCIVKHFYAIFAYFQRAAIHCGCNRQSVFGRFASSRSFRRQAVGVAADRAAVRKCGNSITPRRCFTMRLFAVVTRESVSTSFLICGKAAIFALRRPLRVCRRSVGGLRGVRPKASRVCLSGGVERVAWRPSARRAGGLDGRRDRVGRRVSGVGLTVEAGGSVCPSVCLSVCWRVCRSVDLGSVSASGLSVGDAVRASPGWVVVGLRGGVWDGRRNVPRRGGSVCPGRRSAAAAGSAFGRYKGMYKMRRRRQPPRRGSGGGRKWEGGQGTVMPERQATGRRSPKKI